MSTPSRWAIKIHALLHDPPHKPLALGRGHERQGRALAEGLAGAIADDKMWKAIKEADALASGADRESWLKDLQVDPRTELSIIHPLDGHPVMVAGTVTGRALELVFSPELIDHVEDLVRGISEAFSGISDERLRYLLIWRFTTDVIRNLEAGTEKHAKRFRLGVLWDLLPADTRIPDHPIVFHDSLVGALAPIAYAGESAALLRFAVGPVQSFIQSARKLSDLWAGSSILAEATWRAMLPIVEEHGPDGVVFPSLRGEPRFDRWLLEKVKGIELPPPLHEAVEETGSHLDRALRIPSLPNVFTAIVPAPNAEDLARRAEEQVRKYWGEETERAAAKAGEGNEFAARAREQASALIEVAWSVTPWPLLDELTDRRLATHPRWHRRELHAAQAMKHSEKLRVALGGYRPNGGLLYTDAFEQAGMLLDDAKRDRVRFTRDEGGLKCSICGEREVLGANGFWEQRSTVRADRNQLGGGEQLCGPCTWKRHFDLQGGSLLGKRQPSTGEIAAARFKLDLIRQSRASAGVNRAIKEFVDAAQHAAETGGIEKGDLKVYTAQAVDLAAREAGEPFLEEFARIDGQWLLPFPRDEAPDTESENTPAAREARTKLLQAAARLRREGERAQMKPPRPYLAVVAFDGDEIGKWVSGTHDGFPRLWDVLHQKVQREIENTRAPIDREIRRFLAPSFHATFSGIAATFSRYTAPMTIEGEGLCGHLVYAGGDDALFFAPIPDALELVRRLRLRFSGWPGPFDGNDAQAAEQDVSPWVAVRLGERGLPMPAGPGDDLDRLGLAFGGAATASAGMCVFHYRWPLGAALDMAREAEKAAKTSKRNALGITIQRRSGSITKTVVPFPEVHRRNDSQPVWELATAPLTQFATLVSLLADDKASPRLASLFRAEVASLHAESDCADRSTLRQDDSTLWEMAQALAERVIERRELEAKKDAKDHLAKCVLGIGKAMRSRSATTTRAIWNWCEALTAAAFLARPGD